MTKVTAQNSTEIVIHIIDSNITSLMNLDIQKMQESTSDQQ